MQRTNRKLSFILVFIWVFLMTLNSFYFHNIGMPVFSVVAAFLSILLIFVFKVRIRSYMRLILYIITYILLSSLLTMLLNDQFALATRIPLFFILVPVVIFSSFLFKEEKELMAKVLKVVVTIHLIFFFTQFIYFYGTGVFIDYILPITGVEQRSLGGSYEIDDSGTKLIRAAGLFNEPGTYSTFIFLILSLIKNTEKKLGKKDRLSLIDILTVISVLLSFSVFGYIFSTFFILKYLLKSSLKSKIIIIACSIPLALLAYERYFSVRFSKDVETSGVGFRTRAIETYINNVQDNPLNLIFGYSNFIDVNELFNVYIVWADLGFLFNIIVSLGFLGLILFAKITLPRLKSHYMLIIVLCLSKLSITTFFLWFFLSCLYLPKYDENENIIPYNNR